MKMTSSYANKLLKSLAEEKAYWLNREKTCCEYIAAVSEEALVPEYDYQNISDKIDEIDRKTCLIKHAVNCANTTSILSVGYEQFPVDSVLIKLAQLNKRKEILDNMRKRIPAERTEPSLFHKNSVPEYRYLNYDPEQVGHDFNKISELIIKMQLALDKHNQTFEFEVDI